MKRAWGLILGVLALAACGRSGIGGECNAALPCLKEHVCLTRATGGYCTILGCGSAGSQGSCPSDSICDRIFTGDNACVKRCTTQADCRLDTECNGVSESNVKACKPKER
jgi:hypothetical protein